MWCRVCRRERITLANSSNSYQSLPHTVPSILQCNNLTLVIRSSLACLLLRLVLVFAAPGSFS